ncbi:OTU domain-containing protein 3 [Gaertneriomyces sp. JEL0708]|nr:OTU domain-containing protein 3 [Gaertneriomyces sp. JEL0708]
MTAGKGAKGKQRHARGAASAPPSRVRNRRIRDVQRDLDETGDDGTKILEHQLARQGLKIKDMTGDGNCLFRALSDQYEGTPDYHAKHRQTVCEHLSQHRDTYAPFVGEDEGSFEQHVCRMRQDGVYGGNMELVAFARAMGVDIAVHQAGEPVWIVSGETEEPTATGGGGGISGQPQRRTLHIAYHSWEHYSSVRNLGGPASGLPDICIVPTDVPPLPERDPDAPPSGVEKMIMGSTGATIGRVRELMMRLKFDPGRVLDYLFEEAEKEENAVAGPDALEGDVGGERSNAEPGQADETPTTSRQNSTTVGTDSEQSLEATDGASHSVAIASRKQKRASARDRKDALRRERKERAIARKGGKVVQGENGELVNNESGANIVVESMKAIRI